MAQNENNKYSEVAPPIRVYPGEVHQVCSARPPKGNETANITCGHCGFNAIVMVTEIQNSDWKCPRCRDQFAMAALAGFGCGVKPQEMARLCYEAAYAMMEARKPKASG